MSSKADLHSSLSFCFLPVHLSDSQRAEVSEPFHCSSRVECGQKGCDLAWVTAAYCITYAAAESVALIYSNILKKTEVRLPSFCKSVKHTNAHKKTIKGIHVCLHSVERQNTTNTHSHSWFFFRRILNNINTVGKCEYLLLCNVSNSVFLNMLQFTVMSQYLKSLSSHNLIN